MHALGRLYRQSEPSLRGRVARRQPRREGFSPTFAVCVRRRSEPLSLLRRQLPSQGSQTAGNIALSHTRPCRENRKQRHCTDSFRPCVLAEITFSTSCQAFLKACGFQRRRLWSPTAVGEILTTPKAQEGSQNSPVDCFGVGNPRRGFPVAKHKSHKNP